ncbi:hypothetical protein WI94_10360 [Burkholderia vietnamiensis]|nr:hypothetical protein WI94_10360 [Burkholderia vietnamiensis]
MRGSSMRCATTRRSHAITGCRRCAVTYAKLGHADEAKVEFRRAAEATRNARERALPLGRVADA